MDPDLRVEDREEGRGGPPLGASSRHAIAIARFGTFSTQKNYFGKDGGPMTPPEQGVSGLRGFGATGP